MIIKFDIQSEIEIGSAQEPTAKKERNEIDGLF
jgi:hypothetical protein